MTSAADPTMSAQRLEEAVRIRTKPPQPKRLSRKVLLAGVGGAGLVVAFAVLSGLSESRPRSAKAQGEPVPAAATSAPEALTNLPSRYDSSLLAHAAIQGAETEDMLRDDGAADAEAAARRLDPPADPFWANAPSSRSSTSVGAAAPPASQRTLDPATAPIFFSARRAGAGASPPIDRVPTDASLEGGGRREGFLARQQASAATLDSAYVPPASPFAVQAGSVIPAALVTAVNSDLPGRVIAQVTAPVYDSVTGETLLIPQGARLLGTYDSANIDGDDRVFFVWNRIIMPNGWSMALSGMEATDPEGAAGLAARTDNHLGRLGSAIGLSAVLSILANRAEDKRDRFSFSQSVGDAAAQEAARVGGKIVDRALAIRPTLRVRPGAPVRVLVTRDIALRPYRE